jgi:hypothetical protein
MRRICVTMCGRQCLCVGTGSKPCTFTSVHWRPTFISRMNRARITFIPLKITYKTCLYMERLWNVSVWTRSVSDSCVGCALDVRGILHRICSYASTWAICQWFVSDCKWYVRFVSDFYPRHPEELVNFSTPKPSLCVICVSDSFVIGCVTGRLGL